jgi:hypothetical protein
LATTTASGFSGSIYADASTSLQSGQLIQSVSASATSGVDGKSVACAEALIAASAPAFATTGQIMAVAIAAPSATTTNAVLAANSEIKSSFGASPVFFAVAELGGRYSTDGTASQTTTSTMNETIDLTQLKNRQNLVIGLYDGASIGTAGVTGVTFQLYVDGMEEIDQTFATVAAAKTYFTNDAVNLGSLANGQTLGADTLSISATLSITSDAANSGFFGDLIIGDPPAHSATSTTSTAATTRFADAMAGFGAKTGESFLLGALGSRSSTPTLSGPRLAEA